MSSSLLSPFRCIGRISASVPLCVYNLGSESFCSSAVGRSFHVYSCSKLRLVLASKALTHTVTALAALGQLTFVAAGREISVWNRYELVGVWKGHSEEISHLMEFGTHVLSIAGTTLKVWEVDTGECETIELEKQFGKVTVLMHPTTYLNKVLIGYEKGKLQLWNVKTKSLIYSFNLPKKGKEISEYSITALCNSPILDIVTVGTSDGRIWFLHLKRDEIMSELMHTSNKMASSNDAVTCLCFRAGSSSTTDNIADDLLSGSANGSIAVWNWKETKLLQILPDAHTSVISMSTVGNAIITNGDDNAIRMWMFEGATGLRLLRYRDGPSQPPIRVRYMDDGLHLLVASLDQTFRVLAIRRDEQAVTLSQRGVDGKHFGKVDNRWNAVGYGSDYNDTERQQMLSLISDLSSSSRKERQWANVLTVHRNSSEVRAWKTKTGAIDPRHFSNPSGKPLSSCCISGCGNFGIIGGLDGAITRFNLQSFQKRGSYEDTSLRGEKAHASSVVALACDLINRYVVSAGQEGIIKFWDFHDLSLKKTIELKRSGDAECFAIQSMIYHPMNELIAVSRDDLTIFLVDCETKKVVRIFEGYSHRVSDLAFSHDGRWLIAASLDCCLYIWDIPSGSLIDWVRFESAVSSVAMSPTGDFIATTHINQLGVCLWANLAHFTNVFYASQKAPTDLQLPMENTDDTANEDDVIDEADVTLGKRSALEDLSANESDSEGDDGFARPIVDHSTIATKALENSSELITLSSLPRAKWVNLTQLDNIKARNKPKDLIKKRVDAPFFLPTVSGISADVQFILPDASQRGRSGSKVLNHTAQHPEGNTLYVKSKLIELLENCHDQSSVLAVLGYLSDMSISAVDASIRQIGVDFANEERELRLFLQFLNLGMHADSKTHIDLLEAYMQLFLKIHAAILTTYPALRSELEMLKAAQAGMWRRLEESFQANLSLVKYLSNMQI